jgi:hypothetical protein
MPAAEKTLAFSKVKYDSTDIPPDAPAGRWTATLKVIKSTTGKDGAPKYPMFKLQWKLKTCLSHDDEEHEKALGSSVFDYLGFVPKGHKWEQGCKKKNRDLAKLAGVELSSLPTVYKEWSDFDEYIAALDGQTFEIGTVVTEKDGEKRTEARYTKPSGEVPPLKDVDDEDDEEPPAEGPEEEDEDEEEDDDEEEDEDEEDEPPKTVAKGVKKTAPPLKVVGRKK